MEKLLRGIHAFQREVFRSHEDFFARLARGQRPEALFITCSDSRIAPNLLTQTAPGDLFIMRNAGNLVPPYGAVHGGEAATLEYAIVALGIRDVIVCGHSDCGAMRALLDPSSCEQMPAVRRWLEHAEATRRVLASRYQTAEGAALLSAAIQENVLTQLENLRTHPAVAAALARRELHLHGWVYGIDSGDVFAFDPQQEQFVRLDPARGAVPAVGRRAGAAAI
jgi:carbonic anhydrase